MTDHKYTDEEVIRAFECCIADVIQCWQCPLRRVQDCRYELSRYVLDLINRQRAEIAALVSAVDNSTKEFLKLHDDYQDQKAEIERLQWGEYRHIGKTVLNARNEGIEDFAERLKEKHRRITDYDEAGFGCQIFIVEEDYIDRLVKEMTEGKPCTEGADCSTCENCYHDGGYNECATDGVK